MQLTEAELAYREERIEVWSAMSDLWLDADFDDAERAHVASVIGCIQLFGLGT